MEELEQISEPKGLSWQVCEDICRHYMNPENKGNREKIGFQFLAELQKVKAAHSIRLRHKGVVSLIRKIIDKKAEKEPKYL